MMLAWRGCAFPGLGSAAAGSRVCGVQCQVKAHGICICQSGQVGLFFPDLITFLNTYCESFQVYTELEHGRCHPAAVTPVSCVLVSAAPSVICPEYFKANHTGSFAFRQFTVNGCYASARQSPLMSPARFGPCWRLHHEGQLSVV